METLTRTMHITPKCIFRLILAFSASRYQDLQELQDQNPGMGGWALAISCLSAGHTDSSLRRKVLLFLAELRDSFLWVAPLDGEKVFVSVCVCVRVVILCGIIAWIWVVEFTVAIKGVETARERGEVVVVLRELEAGGGGVFKLIWSWMPQRRGRCGLATHPDRNLSRLHHCFVFQINWPLKIALHPSQHYWCTFFLPSIKSVHPTCSTRLLAPLVTENKLGLHIRA